MFSYFLYALLFSLFCNILVIRVASKYHLFIDDYTSHKPQKFHTYNTPRAGGIGILSALFFILSVPFGLNLSIPLLLSFLSGIFEDFHNSLSPKFRLFLQLIAAISAIFFTGSVITYLGLGIFLPYWGGVVFSIFAIVGMMNAINIIDGFNGLASGTTLLVLLSFSSAAYQQHDTEALHIILITIGAVFGFFILNFPKGKIFLGDGGAYMLGFMIALIGIYLAATYEYISPWYVLATLIYPVWEVVFSITRRILLGQSSMMADAAHLHTLIYKFITKNNALTALMILLMEFPFLALSAQFPDHSKINIFIIITFITGYTLLYRYLSKKENTQHTP